MKFGSSISAQVRLLYGLLKNRNIQACWPKMPKGSFAWSSRSLKYWDIQPCD